MKKFLTLLLVLAMICCLLPAAYAADNTAETAAATLYSLGLFSGTGTNSDGTPKFDLNRTLNRAEAVTMLVNLLGKSDAAAAGSWTSPFKDVPDWAKAAVGYAYESGLVGGLNADTFGSRQPVTANQFAALVLRALGYKDGQDFSFADAAKFAEKLGLTETDQTAVKTFLRGDAVKIAAAALSVDYKDSGAVLSQVIAMSKELAAQSGKDIPVDEIAALVTKLTDSKGGKLSAEDIAAAAKIVAAEYDAGLPVDKIADVTVTIINSKGSDIPAAEIAEVVKAVVAKYGTDVPADELADIAVTIIESKGADVPADKIASAAAAAASGAGVEISAQDVSGIITLIQGFIK